MYIKIKHLKYATLSLACLFFASHAYSTYVKADDVQVNSYAAEDPSLNLTTQFAQELKSFVDSKGNQTISTSDLNAFVNDSMSKRIGEPITMDTLPDANTSKIKILDQTYPLLKSDVKKNQIIADAKKYSENLSYVFFSNSPTPLITGEDFSLFGKDFLLQLNSLSSNKANYAYFSNLGDKLTIVLEQLENFEVPSGMMPLHIKTMRIIKGFLSLRDLTNNPEDPISKMILLSKAQGLITISADFLSNDVTPYFSNLEN